MFRSFPLAARIVSFIIVPILIFAGATYNYVQSSKPDINGVLRVDGLDAALTIERDTNGAVFIKAESDRDVYFAMGYVHAQDRLWQLEVNRRIASGRLSEVFGRKTLQQDILFRTLDLHGAAAKAWTALSPEAQSSLHAYAAGINAWLKAGKRLPPEFAMFGISPAQWAPVDSLAMMKILAFNLSGNMGIELERMAASRVLNAAQMQALFPGYPSGAPVTVPAGSEAAVLGPLVSLKEQVEQQLQLGGRHVGSNAWVVSGRLTEDGSPLLANDPHMSLPMPSLWYAVSQSGATLRVKGMSLVGMPLVVFGSNASVAWGGTNMMADVQDVYFEQIDATNPSRYRSVDGTWLAFQTRDTTISIKADFPAELRPAPVPVKLRIRSTEHGPLISDVIGAVEYPAALRWTALDANDTSYEALYRLSYVRDWAGFRQALAKHVTPVLNMLYADKAGNIGYVGAGRIPIRQTGRGAVPVNGGDPQYRWTGYVAAEDMPASLNPERGYIVSANNKVVDDTYPYFITEDWAPPARARRIGQILQAQIAAGRRFSLGDMQRIQSDVLDLEAKRLLPLLAGMRPADARQAEALRHLAAWDGTMRPDSHAATLYSVWMPHLRREVFGSALGGSWSRAGRDPAIDSVMLNAPLEALENALQGKEPGWCGVVRPAACELAMQRSLDRSLSELSKAAGSDMTSWKWGALHGIRFRHQPFDDVKVLDALFSRRAAGGGSSATVNVGNSRKDPSGHYVQSFGAAFRQLIRLGDGAHLYVNSTGQSGHPLSRHYDDMILPYTEGQYFRLDTPEPSGKPAELTQTHAK